ncbi:hypothetical protein L9F63_003763, partial [Diploptera punctata]
YVSLPSIPAFQRFLSSHCPSSIPFFIMTLYIPSYHVLVFLPLFLLPALFVILSITISCASISCLIFFSASFHFSHT